MIYCGKRRPNVIYEILEKGGGLFKKEKISFRWSIPCCVVAGDLPEKGKAHHRTGFEKLEKLELLL